MCHFCNAYMRSYLAAASLGATRLLMGGSGCEAMSLAHMLSLQCVVSRDPKPFELRQYYTKRKGVVQARTALGQRRLVHGSVGFGSKRQ